MTIIHNPEIQRFCVSQYTPELVDELISFLERQGTFRFPTLPNGLFSAALAATEEFDYTGYHHIWVRDNIHIAHAHLVIGKSAVAVTTARTLLEWFGRQQLRFAAVIANGIEAHEPMRRPHIRFQGHTLSDSTEKWSHAQNDALGYFLWLYCKLIRAGEIVWDSRAAEILPLFPLFWLSVRFWEDEDSGHWEETRKIEASSIGVVVAGLSEFREVLLHLGMQSGEFPGSEDLLQVIDGLLERGRAALDAILPAECVQDDPTKNRRFDSALLFLIYPTAVVTGDMADQIVADVTQNLMGEFGIRRYLGDSYWCADYKTALAPEVRTSDFSDDLSSRDKLLKPGLEAQWCIFDPIISIHHGLKYQKTGDPKDLERQIFHVQRSLGQLTGPDSAFKPFLCPESYYCENGKYGPNDVTPLLWTQANLRLALEFLKQSVQRV